jgi:hypothetical protein
LKHLALFENWTPETAGEWQMRRAAASDLLTLPQVYARYIKDDRYPEFRELMYRIWKNLTHEDQSKIQRLEELGLFDPADITVEQLMYLPGVNDIVKVFDTTNGGKSAEEHNLIVNSIFPGLVHYTNPYDSRINWNEIERADAVDNGNTDITLVKGYVSGAEGPNGEIPILVLSSYYSEAWMNINDIG